MRNALKKITVTFVLISLIPLGFIVYELSSLSSNERMVNEAYRNQLDAILYSVNQHTDDVFSSWASKTDILLFEATRDSLRPNLKEKVEHQLAEMPSVKEICFSDLQRVNEVYRYSDTARSVVSDYTGLIAKLESRITRLKTYQRGGYRKIDAMDTLIADRYIPVYFLLDEDIDDFRLAVFLIDLSEFLQSVLAPKMQAVSQGRFVISAFERKNNTLLYSTESVHPADTFVDGEEDRDEITKKAISSLPGYYLGISLKESTISGLVRSRLITSIVIFSVLFVLLAAAIIFLYRNVRKEILLSQAKSEFVSNVSHEIRTPLSLISMYAETLELNRVPENRKQEYYTIIHKETERLAGVVNRILNFAQLDANKKKFEFRNKDLNQVVSAVLKSYSHHLTEKGFTLNTVFSPTALVVAMDEHAISEALINLIDNAIKYSAETKQITVRTGTETDLAYVDVEDKGIGIARVHQGHIFDQFYRVPTHNVHTAKGTGLGLALVRKTMTAHKGKVTVESSPGTGSRFRLSFPFVKQTKSSLNDQDISS
jgi:two-component system, OmpR family, phosphate regulon sensor histidine kinase PhoR